MGSFLVNQIRVTLPNFAGKVGVVERDSSLKATQHTKHYVSATYGYNSHPYTFCKWDHPQQIKLEGN